MSHLDFVRPGGQWSGEMVPGAQDFQRLDDHQSRIIDGDNGGTWNPTGPIGIGGAGITFTTAPTQFAGGVTTATGGRVVLANVSGNTPTIVPPMTDKIVISAADLMAPVAQLAANGGSWLPDDYIQVTSAPGAVGAQSILTLSAGAVAFLPLPRRYLHQGASFSSLRLNFRVLSKPTSSTLPSLAFSPVIFTPSTATTYTTAPLFFNGTAWTFNNWLAGSPAAVGEYVIPSPGFANNTNGYYYKCTSISGSGTTGTNAALFQGVTTIGATVTDNPGANQVVWTCWGKSGQLSNAGLDAASYYNNGQPQALEFDFDTSAPAVLAQNAVDHGTYTYGIAFGDLGDWSTTVASVNIVLHTIELTFANITDMRFS